MLIEQEKPKPTSTDWNKKVLRNETVQNPTYIINQVEKPLEKAGYSLQYQLNGLTRYIREKYEINIVLDVAIPYRLYLVQRLDSCTAYEIMSTVDTFGHYIYENAPIDEFMKIATKPNSDILMAVSNHATEKILEVLE